MTYTPPEQYATEKQLSFINALCEQRQLTEEVKAHVEGQVVSGTMTKAEASKRIEWLLAQPKLPKPVTVYAEVPEGMHKTDGKIWKVYRTRNGHQVAAELIGMMGDEGEVWGFEYRGKSGLKGLSEATRMNEEDAKAFGKTYGICVRCAAQLTDERSIFAGYGPVCAKHQGWYYPTMDEAMEGLGITPESISTALIEGKKPIEVTKEEVLAKIFTEADWELAELEAKADAAAHEEMKKDPFDAFLPVSTSLRADEIAERMDRVCDFSGCDNKVFTDADIKADVHLAINPDYCIHHDTGETESGMGPADSTFTEGPLRMELLPEDL
jgi:hypothetical protein